jgi:dienelactone hydrolase
MAIERRTLIHDGPGGPFEGILAFDTDADEPRPGVLIVPNVLGQKEADNRVAEQLAALGYVGFAADVFGQGKRTTRDSPDPATYMNALNADRSLLRDRLHASLAVLKAQPEVDAARTAAIGFCFGGKCVLDLARSGADLRAVVSFHGIFDRPDYPNVTPIAPRVLVCHGWADPLAPPDAVTALAAELTDGGARWELDAYGHAGHGFTDRSMQGSTRPGFGYEAAADTASWAAMRRVLDDALA